MIVEIEKARIECVEVGQNNCYGKFVVEPLERGFGHTLGCLLYTSCSQPNTAPRRWVQTSPGRG